MSDSNHLIRPKQVAPLPIGSGGNNATKRQLNETNNQLTMMMSQSMADTKYDPPVPKHISAPVTVERFEIYSNYQIINVIGLLLIAYGIIAK